MKTLYKLEKLAGFSFWCGRKTFKNGAFRKRFTNWRNLEAFRFGDDAKHFKNGAFRKRFTNWRNLEAFRFGVDGKHFKNGAFLKRWHHDDRVISLTEFIKHKSIMTGDFCFFFISPSYCRRKTFEAFSELKPTVAHKCHAKIVIFLSF